MSQSDNNKLRFDGIIQVQLSSLIDTLNSEAEERDFKIVQIFQSSAGWVAIVDYQPPLDVVVHLIGGEDYEFELDDSDKNGGVVSSA